MSAMSEQGKNGSHVTRATIVMVNTIAEIVDAVTTWTIVAQLKAVNVAHVIKYNHWQSVCRQEKGSGTEDKRHQSTDRRRRKSRDRTPYRTHEDQGRGVNSISQATGQLTENFETMAFDTVKVGADNRDEVYATLNIELKNRPDIPATLKAKVDTGAQGNVLPLRTYKRMYPSDIAADGLPKRGRLENNDTVLTAYNGQPIPQYGTLRLRCSHAANKCEAMFFVADTPGPAIIGLPSCRELSLVVLNCEITKTAQINTKDDLQRQYPDRFEGIGKFRGDFHITMDPTVTPVIPAERRCSIHLKDEVKAELDNMEELGVIERVTEPTDWVSSIVYSRKPSGKLRICLDPKDLNKAIKRPHYHTPTLEEITHKLAGSVMYSKLDATSSANATTDSAVRDHHSVPARQGYGNGRRIVTAAQRQQGADPIGRPAALCPILDAETRDIARRDPARRRADGTPVDNPRWMAGEEERSTRRNT